MTYKCWLIFNQQQLNLFVIVCLLSCLSLYYGDFITVYIHTYMHTYVYVYKVYCVVVFFFNFMY